MFLSQILGEIGQVILNEQLCSKETGCAVLQPASAIAEIMMLAIKKIKKLIFLPPHKNV